MGHTYAGADSFPATITIPDDGDPRNASSVNTPFQGLADRTAYAYNRIHEPTLVRRVPVQPFSEFNSTTPFLLTFFAGQAPAGVAMARVNAFCPNAVNTGAGGFHYIQTLNPILIQGATLASATLKFRPKTGHGALPTRQPGFAILRTPIFGGYHSGSTVSLLSTTGGYAKLTAANVAAYEVDTTLTFTSDQNHTSIDLDTYIYTLCIADESGTNALADSDYYQLAISLSSVTDSRRSG